MRSLSFLSLLPLFFLSLEVILAFPANEHPHQLEKRDASPFPADKAFAGCSVSTAWFNAPTWRNGAGRVTRCGRKTDTDVQMGECGSNDRIQNNVFAIFVPYLPGDPHYDSEGGPYGYCSAFDCQPLATDLTKEANPSNACFLWSYKEDRPAVPNEIPGESFVPPPMICPHNLPDCYSKNYYDRGGKLARVRYLHPENYKGAYFSIKKSSDDKRAFCDCFYCGCPAPNYSLMQDPNAYRCRVSRCKPYTGVRTVRADLPRCGNGNPCADIATGNAKCRHRECVTGPGGGDFGAGN